MKKIPILLLLALATLFNNHSFARLNETEAQCIQRYGESVHYGSTMISPLKLRFNYCSWAIDTGFSHGVVTMIRYSQRVEISEREFRLILDAEGGIANWRKVGNRLFLGGTEWRRNDGATAIVYKTCALLTAGTRNDTVSYSSNSHSADWEKGYPVF